MRVGWGRRVGRVFMIIDFSILKGKKRKKRRGFGIVGRLRDETEWDAQGRVNE